MRLWSLHPDYLDRQGLVAAWREGLLAKKVLEGGTKGYRNHPQLQRFKDSPQPLDSINVYLQALAESAATRGYNFDASKLKIPKTHQKLTVTDGQLEYERLHLYKKLEQRDPTRLKAIGRGQKIRPHPLFIVESGPIAEWEMTK